MRTSVPGQAIVTDPELVAYLAGFCAPFEDWPVANPLAPVGSVLVIGRKPILVVANMYESWLPSQGPETLVYRSYQTSSPPDPVSELETTLGRAFTRAGLKDGTVAIDTTFPHFLVSVLERHGLRPARAEIKPTLDEELVAAVGRAARLADVAQGAIARLVEPGCSEAELAGLALAAVAEEAGMRLPAILTVTSGPASGGRAGPATARVVQEGDLVLCDVAPWVDGAWADAATTVCAGRPSARQRRLFDAVRAALELAVELCTPGAIGRDVDGAVRERLEGAGPVYRHHTGHGLGVRWWQEPLITPYSEMHIEEGAVLAVEPALYDPEVGGVRLEVTLRVRSGGNELLTRYEHRLTQ